MSEEIWRNASYAVATQIERLERDCVVKKACWNVEREIAQVSESDIGVTPIAAHFTIFSNRYCKDTSPLNALAAMPVMTLGDR